jgi:hypothetical protein
MLRACEVRALPPGERPAFDPSAAQPALAHGLCCVRRRRRWVLSVGARQLSITRPSYAGSKAPKSLQVNVIYVNEVDVPKGTEPVEWILFTTEPAKTKKQILRVVDIYRTRWLIVAPCARPARLPSKTGGLRGSPLNPIRPE